MLDPEHFLDLIPDRRAVLEEERHLLADGDATLLLVRDDAPADRLPMARIALAAEDVFDGDRPHHPVLASALPSYAASRASTGW